MSWNNAYLDAVDVPRWIPREIDTAEVGSDDKVVNASAESVQIQSSETSIDEPVHGVKALVNNPKAKFAILVSDEMPKADLQKAWKQLKFAWKQWQNQEFPASLFQLSLESDFSLSKLEKQDLLIIDTTKKSNQPQKISAPKLLEDKKMWWQLLQQVTDKSQLL